MASEVSICNQAISWVGGELITALSQDSTEAKLCNALYAELRDTVLEAHDWTFATSRKNLALSAASPANGYTNAFLIPSDVLRVLSVNDNDDWQIEGEYIVTNEVAAKIRAIVRITDPNRFSTLFRQALASRLAADLAIPLTKSKTLQTQMFNAYGLKLSEAVTNDGLQGKSRRITSKWLRRSRSG